MSGIVAVGDSWGKVVAGGGTPWPDIMGAKNLNHSGSTAQQWANNHNGWLGEAKDTEGDTLVVSLMGNDARHAVEDKVVTPTEIAVALSSMRTVVETLHRERTIVLLYADPFDGEVELSRVAIPLLNGAIRMACAGLDVAFYNTEEAVCPGFFDGKDIHPTQVGHTEIAMGLRDLINEMELL
jgi:hypothetical protein